MQKLWVNERYKKKQQSQEQARICSPKSNRKGPQVCLFLILFSEVQVSPEKNKPLCGCRDDNQHKTGTHISASESSTI
jgi:hypothetical protein